jgi:tRNA-2-methylthio-N6-dimethylallyladenosine synthase
MNVYDSEIIESIVKPIGFTITNNIDDADLIILNTCHIREKAAEKIYSELGRINVLEKKKNKKIITVVAGCVAQAEGDYIAKRAKNVDIVVGPQSIHTLPELITKVHRKNGFEINLNFNPIEKFDYLKGEIKSNNKTSAFLSIQEGCDKFCTFCVVPYTRGAEYSRTVNEIYDEAANLVKSGVKEIILLGQNVNGYHGIHSKDYIEQEYSLGRLITYIAELDGLERIRYMTSHPVDMHDELYKAHQIETKLMPFIHLPIQSGSDNILRKMNRKYTASQYIEIVDQLRKCRPDIGFSSDFIVGFPTETEDDFEKTLELVQKVKYAQCYSFKYSPRPGTPSAELKQIDEKIKDLRLQKLQTILREQQLEFNQNCIGKIMPVLFDKKNDKQLVGKTEYMQSVYLNDFSFFTKIVNMKITGASQNTVSGVVV